MCFIYYIGFHYLFSVFMNKSNKDIYFPASILTVVPLISVGLLGEMLFFFSYDIYHNSDRFIRLIFPVDCVQILIQMAFFTLQLYKSNIKSDFST